MDYNSMPTENMVCIEYPGLVKNPNKMIDTLGGRSSVSKAFEDPNRRLELRFRPSDIFSKPTCSERNNTTSLLVKVVRYKKKRKKCSCQCSKVTINMSSECKKSKVDESLSNDTSFKIGTKVMGSARITYSFPNMSDFQYLPTERVMNEANDSPKDSECGNINDDGNKQTSDENNGAVLHRPIMDNVYYGDKHLPGAKWLTMQESGTAPLFLPPAAFTRMDQPQDYHYRKDTSTQAIKSNLSVPQTIIGRTRQRRTLHAVFVNYENPKVPERPSEVALHQLKVKFIDETMLNEVHEAFKNQPIWTKTGLSAVTGQPLERLKFILPTVAYYFTSGPWRNQWVRFGYDPRQDISSGIYQTLDYRVRLEGGAKLKVRAKRSYANYILPYQSTNPSKSRTSTIIREALIGSDQNTPIGDHVPALDIEKDIKRSNYIFEKGVIPPCRQMFYQYKDIKLEEAQNLVKSKMQKSAQDIGSGTQSCSERNGWFEPGLDAGLREIMTKSITQSLTSNLKPPPTNVS